MASVDLDADKDNQQASTMLIRRELSELRAENRQLRDNMAIVMAGMQELLETETTSSDQAQGTRERFSKLREQ